MRGSRKVLELLNITPGNIKLFKKSLLLRFFFVIFILKKKLDFIIVGQGIAGTTLAFKLLQKKYSVRVIDKFNPNSSSSIALGLYNPLVLKWFTKSWEVDNQLNDMFDYFEEFEKILKLKSTTKKTFINY